jgi:hypothetical protein
MDPGGPCSWGRFGSNPVPLRERVESPWVSPLELTFVYLCQFLLLNACTLLHRIWGMHAAPPQGVTLPKDMASREANYIHSERLWVHRKRRRA